MAELFDPNEEMNPKPVPVTYGDALQSAADIIADLRQLRVTIEVDEDLAELERLVNSARSLITDQEIQAFVLTAGREGNYPGVTIPRGKR